MKKKIILFLLVFSAVVMMLTACSGKKTESTPDAAATQDMTATPEDIVIKTAYCDLHYPLMWEDRFSFEISENTPYTVKCYATIDKHKPIGFFDVVFGGSEGASVGSVNNVSVSIVINDITYDKTWTDSEISAVNAMLDDIDYLVTKLSSVDGYSE